MKEICSADSSTFKHVRFVLTDMDETLTYKGRLAAETYMALERLQNAGVNMIPVTVAPAGWSDQMAWMWPVDGVIGENGGVFSEGKMTAMALRVSSVTPQKNILTSLDA